MGIKLGYFGPIKKAIMSFFSESLELNIIETYKRNEALTCDRAIKNINRH